MENRGGKYGKRCVVGDYIADRLVQIAQERLEIDQGRTTIDPVRLAGDFKLPGVTCGAGYSDKLGFGRTGSVEAHRETGAVVRIRQKTVSGHAVRQKRSPVLGL